MPPVNACASVDGADVWVSCSLSFSPFQYFLCFALVQGHYVMLMRAPHLEKSHRDAVFAELTLKLKKQLTCKRH